MPIHVFILAPLRMSIQDLDKNLRQLAAAALRWS